VIVPVSLVIFLKGKTFLELNFGKQIYSEKKAET
jgi:hypothetical protein